MNWFKAATVKERSGDILVPFNAKWLKLLMEDKISVIFRRRIPSSFEPKGLYIYINSPEKILIGFTNIDDTKKVIFSEAKILLEKARLTEEELQNYFLGYTNIGIYFIGPIRKFKTPIKLEELNKEMGFIPPQSFVALSHDASNYLSNRLGVKR
jgi:predicted transcriptional regulator